VGGRCPGATRRTEEGHGKKNRLARNRVKSPPGGGNDLDYTERNPSAGYEPQNWWTSAPKKKDKGDARKGGRLGRPQNPLSVRGERRSSCVIRKTLAANATSQVVAKSSKKKRRGKDDEGEAKRCSVRSRTERGQGRNVPYVLPWASKEATAGRRRVLE